MPLLHYTDEYRMRQVCRCSLQYLLFAQMLIELYMFDRIITWQKEFVK